MNSYERVMASLNLSKPDRIPVSLWFHWYNTFAGFGYQEYCKDGEKFARSHLAFLERLRVDYLKVTPDGNHMVEDWGCKLEWNEPEAHTKIVEHSVLSVEDWETLEPLNPNRCKMLSAQLVAAKILAERIGNKTPFIFTLFSPLTIAIKLAGSETVTAHIRGAKRPLLRGLRTVTEFTIDFGEALLDQGATGIFYATQVATKDFLTSEQYDEFCLPFDMRVLGALSHSDMTVLHLHSEKRGDEIPFERIARYRVDALNWWDRGGIPTLVDAKRLYGDKFCLIGGLDHTSTLHHGSPSEVRREAREAIGQGGPEGFMLGPGCTVAARAKLENFEAAIEAVGSSVVP